ncbi:MAG: hypothetical protein IGS03_17335 [Candidatus Sericytochromatia bacterium]|nr:hypothetical protein [Candidatus Sericytochromatia bacterium]
MTDTFDPRRNTDISSFLDQEAPAGENTRQLLESSFGAQVHYRNIENISRACQQQGVPVGQHPGFLDRLMGALDGLEQLAETEDFECLSAWHDGMHPIEDETALEQGAAQTCLQNIRSLAQAMQALPQMQAQADFADIVMAALPQDHRDENERRLGQALQALPQIQAPEGFAQQVTQAIAQQESLAETNAQRLTAALQALPQPEVPAGFAQQVMQRIEALTQDTHSQNQQRLDLALQALPQIQAPADFAARVMQQIDTLQQPISAEDTENISACLDGELSEHESRQTLKALQANPALSRQHRQHQQLSAALQALPRPEATPGFVAKVMLATEQAARPKLFALPWLMRSRAGQMVAGFGLFGLLVMLSQTLVTGTQGPTEVATGPQVQIIQVEHQPEDLLFTDMIDMDNVLEHVAEEDYNLWIGG